MSKQFDVLVIGGGPGGYVAAIRAAQLGLKTACADDWKNPAGQPSLGGTCLNVGCIPSKALLQSSEYYELAQHQFASHGIKVSGVGLDLSAMMARKDKIVGQLTGGIAMLFKKNKVEWLKGRASFTGRAGELWQVQVNGEQVTAKNVIIATGSYARHLPGVAVDNQIVCDNIGALAFDSVPKKLGVIGAGVIGLELGSVWKRLGADVTILEGADSFLSLADEAVQKEAWKQFTKEQGLNIQLGAKVSAVKATKKGATIEYADKDGNAQSLACDRLIVSIGRAPNTEGLNLDVTGLKTDARGYIEVDGHCRTSQPNLYAVGDVVRGPMLAHKAMEEGVMVSEIIAGQVGHVNLDTVPWVIYTEPEIAWVGKTEQQLKKEGIAYRSGQIPFLANGRALGQGAPAGFVKMLACARTDTILGVHIIGNGASELISEAVVAMEFGASSEDIARIVHAHPTRSEVMHEAALAVDKRPLHM